MIASSANDLGREPVPACGGTRRPIEQFETTLTIDPEDLTAHYNLMLCYNGIGDRRDRRSTSSATCGFKADESAQAITGPYRLKHPQDNNERQAIHEHESAELSRTTGPARMTSNGLRAPGSGPRAASPGN